MEEEYEQQHPPEHTRWQRFKVVATAELRWLAETSGVVVVTLSLSRLLSKLGLDIDKVTGGNWAEMVRRAFRGEERNP